MPPSFFRNAVRDVALEARSAFKQLARLENNSIYMQWRGLGQFLVSADGSSVLCARAPQASIESFQVYLLNQAISFALVKSGFEPLHATVLATNGGAIALLGDSGYGKSTLAAFFLNHGHSLLTDDLLLISPEGFDAHPGPARIKLYPTIAKRFLNDSGTVVRMNSGTEKRIIPLSPSQSCAKPLPLRAVYVLSPPAETRYNRRVQIVTLPAKTAFMALLTNTFNSTLVDSERLQRQIAETARLVRSVPVKKLSYPRSLLRLPEVLDAILCDSTTWREKTA